MAFEHSVAPDKLSKPCVAIMGFTDHRVQAFSLPRDRFELWGLNELHRYHQKEVDEGRFDRWFEIHPREALEPDKPHLETLAKMKCPVYMHRHFEDIPPTVPFPREIIEQALESRYFTSSIAWEIAYAVLLIRARWAEQGHADDAEIHVYGVDMAQDCLAPETRVLTADMHWVRADEVRAGDDLMGFDEESGIGTAGVGEARRAMAGGGTAVITPATVRAARHWRVAKVVSRSVAMRPGYRIHFEDGTSVVASAGHKWLTRAENGIRWRRTDELVTPQHRPGRPTRVLKVLDTWEDDRSWEAGYLAAAFDGEGHLSQHPHRTGGTHALTLGFAQRDNAMADRVRVALALKGFEWGEHQNGSVTNYTIKGGRSELLRFLGQIRPERLLDKFEPVLIGHMQRKKAVAVTRIEFLGEVETVGFTTTTGTLIAEGFASHNSEYAEQRNCCEYWLGVAKGAGIRIHVPPTADLLKAIGQYGFGETASEFAAKLNEREMWLHAQDNDRLTNIRRLQAEYEQKKAQLEHEYQAQMEPMKAERNQIVGAIQDTMYWKRSWAITGSAPSAVGPSPDRSQDPRTGIAAAQSDNRPAADADAVTVTNRIAAVAGKE